MQIPNEWLNGIIGAVAALAVAKFAGWLHVPFLEGGSTSVTPRQPVYQQAAVSSTSPTYETTVNIPHKISVTPQ